MSKDENFNKFKSIAGITLVVVLIISFINLLSSENASIQIHDVVRTRARFSTPQLIMGAVNNPVG